MKNILHHASPLPVRGRLTPFYILSVLIALLMVGASAAGLLDPAPVYPSEALLQSFVPNDVVNLLIGMPILLGSMWLASRGRLLGLLCWPGALFYVFYNYLADVFAVPLSWGFLAHLSLAALSAYTLIGLIAIMDCESVCQRLSGAVHERLSGGVLTAFGLMILVRVLGVAFSAITSATLPSDAEFAVSISDYFIAPAFITGGILLWRRKPLGYAAGLGLLFQASMLFIGLIAYLLLQPILTSAPFAPVDIAVIFLMGLVCFVPFVLYVRGLARN